MFMMGCMCGKEEVNIGGRVFRLVETLGEGGFSIVYLAEERGKRGRWAIKCIECHSSEDEKKAKAEIALHQRLSDCPNVIHCEASSVGKSRSGNADSEVYIVLPYYKRGTLNDELLLRFISKEAISEKRIISLFRDICKGVKAFHDMKPESYVHGDIKCANVLVSDDNEHAVIMDLGSARPARQHAKDQRTAQALQDHAAEHCSMPYRAPELFHVETGALLSEKTDIWSLGCVLFALCFFKSPFDEVHERGDSVALAVQSGRVNISPDSRYSGGLLGLLRSLLQLDTEQRPDIDTILFQLDSIDHEVFSNSNMETNIV